MSDEKKDREEFGSGSYTTHVYIVEARSTHGEIVLRLDEHGNPLGNLILTPHEWKHVSVDYGPVGVPNQMELYAEAAAHRFLTYECAMAMACWLQATKKYGGIETRLVQISFKCSYSTELLGRSDAMNLHEDGRKLLWKLQEENKARVATGATALK